MARWISGVVLAVSFILLIYYSPVNFLKGVVLLVSVLCAYEYSAMAFQKNKSLLIVTLLLIVGSLLVLLYQPKLFILCPFVAFYIVFFSQFFQKVENKTRFQQAAYLGLGFLYLAFPFACLLLLIEFKNYRYWIFLVMACTFIPDTMAYIFGKTFGKHKLAPSLSPGKTWEGFIGSILGGMIGGVIINSLTNIFEIQLQTWFILLLGAVLAASGVVGDLSESMIKRAVGVKDSGRLIPGHGGVLDRIDGLLFNMPIIFIVGFFMEYAMV